MYNLLRCIHRPSQTSVIRISISARKIQWAFYGATQVKVFCKYENLRIKI